MLNHQQPTLKLIVITLFTFAIALSASAGVPLRWTVETSAANPATFDQFAGATYDLEATLQSRGKPLAITGDPKLYWQTNGMGSAWWTAPATVSGNVLRATWTPACDVGARVYNCFIGITGTVYNAAFQLRLRPSPGAVPNVIDQPPRVLDLANTVVINPPWPTDETIDARIRQVIDDDHIVAPVETNVVTGIISNTVTRQFVEDLGISGGGGGGVDTNAVERIANRAVETNAVTVAATNDIHALVSATNDLASSVSSHASQLSQLSQTKRDKTDYTTADGGSIVTASDLGYVILSGSSAGIGSPYLGFIFSDDHAEYWSDYGPLIDQNSGTPYATGADLATKRDLTNNVCAADSFSSWVPAQTEKPDNPEELDIYFDAPVEIGDGDYGCMLYEYYEGAWHQDTYWTAELSEDGTRAVLEYDKIYTFVRTRIATSGEPFVTQSFVTNKADRSELDPISEDARSAYLYSRSINLYMTANTNAWFAGTNYVFGADAATRQHFAWEPGMDAETVPCSMALYEIRDGSKQCVWDQRDWVSWYWSFKANQMREEIAATNAAIYAAITNDENNAWARRYAATGRVNPDADTTYIDTKAVCLSPGMNWETVATVGGCGYWTIVGNGAVIGGSGTNAVLEIKDFEGNSILRITKGEHRLAWLDSSDFVGQMTDADGWICFDMMANVQPVGYFSTTLESADFVAETDTGCPAQYSWEDLGNGKWRVHFLLKPGVVSATCFAKFQVEIEGKTQVQYNADTVISGGLIFDGVKIAPVIPSGAAVGSTVTWKVVQ